MNTSQLHNHKVLDVTGKKIICTPCQPSVFTHPNIRNVIVDKPFTHTQSVRRTEKSILIIGPAVLRLSLHCDVECEVIHDGPRFPAPMPHRTTDKFSSSHPSIAHVLPRSVCRWVRDDDTTQKGSLCKLDQQSRHITPTPHLTLICKSMRYE